MTSSAARRTGAQSIYALWTGAGVRGLLCALWAREVISHGDDDVTVSWRQSPGSSHSWAHAHQHQHQHHTNNNNNNNNNNNTLAICRLLYLHFSSSPQPAWLLRCLLIRVILPVIGSPKYPRRKTRLLRGMWYASCSA